MPKNKATLPKDTSGDPIGALSPTGVMDDQTTSGTSAGAAFPTGMDGGDIVRVACTAACYFVTGVGAQTAVATDTLLPAGVEYFRIPYGHTHYAVIQVSAAGAFHIEKME